MSVSSISPPVAPSAVLTTARKPQASPATQVSKSTTPPAVKPAADNDGDRDGGGGINVRA